MSVLSARTMKFVDSPAMAAPLMGVSVWEQGINSIDS